MSTAVQESGLSTALLDRMNAKKSSDTKSAAEETQDRFLKLLVAQMKNQDPMDPLDNAEVTTQMAQLSTVTGIDKLNDSLASLMTNYQSSQTLQAAGMIGHGVLSPGASVDLVKGAGLMGFDLPAAADKVGVTIRDAAGSVVRTLNLDAQKAGSSPVAWDGKTDAGTTAPDGRYTFEVSASFNGAKVDATALQFGVVDSVVTSAKGVKLNVGGMDTIDLAGIRQIL